MEVSREQEFGAAGSHQNQAAFDSLRKQFNWESKLEARIVFSRFRIHRSPSTGIAQKKKKTQAANTASTHLGSLCRRDEINIQIGKKRESSFNSQFDPKNEKHRLLSKLNQETGSNGSRALTVAGFLISSPPWLCWSANKTSPATKKAPRSVQIQRESPRRAGRRKSTARRRIPRRRRRHLLPPAAAAHGRTGGVERGSFEGGGGGGKQSSLARAT